MAWIPAENRVRAASASSQRKTLGSALQRPMIARLKSEYGGRARVIRNAGIEVKVTWFVLTVLSAGIVRWICFK
jgi:hypothetical protein